MGGVNTKPATSTKKSKKDKSKVSSRNRSEVQASERINQSKVSKDKSSLSKSKSRPKQKKKSKGKNSEINKSRDKSIIKSGGKPQSKQVFSAFGYEQNKEELNFNEYVAIPAVNAYSKQTVERDVDYGDEKNQVLESKILVKNTMMEYQLDDEGGVARTEGIPTFCYGTKLTHDTWYKNRNDGRRNGHHSPDDRD